MTLEPLLLPHCSISGRSLLEYIIGTHWPVPEAQTRKQVALSPDAQVTLSSSILTFSPTSWNAAQTVTLTLTLSLQPSPSNPPQVLNLRMRLLPPNPHHSNSEPSTLNPHPEPPPTRWSSRLSTTLCLRAHIRGGSSSPSPPTTKATTTSPRPRRWSTSQVATHESV